jgi:predicted NUDIX family NTP pyrophosphohydrolase
MRDTTLLFLVKKDRDTITDICLAMKKRGFGQGRYNGVGESADSRLGRKYIEKGETIEDATRREAEEEVGVITKCGELTFIFSHKEEWNQLVHVYLCESWEGEVMESEEMNPSWFSPSTIPYTEMRPDDIFWLPLVLDNKNVRGRFVFGEGDTILEQEVGLF